MLREDDRAILLELHPQEAAALRRFIAFDSRFSLHQRDCYEALPALLPPRIRRGLVFIDPSYEIKTEYEDIVDLLGLALSRWATGIYLLWYPLLPEARDRRLLRQIERLAPPKTLVSEFSFSGSANGLNGSGLVVVNAPWQFDEELTVAMQYIVDVLGIGAHSITGQRM
jgi:23S rRNA (adenine2030-N6)-methyltransferase